METPPDPYRGRNHFNAEQRPFPTIVNGKIDTENFLEAAAGAVKILEKQGKTFAPVTIDMNGNVKKLTKQYLSDKIKNSTLQDMILAEKAAGLNFAILSLLWFARGLHFIEMYMAKVIEDHDSGIATDSTKDHIMQTYEETLKPYHSWLLQKAVMLSLRVMTNRKADFFNALNESSTMEDFMCDMKIFYSSLRDNRIEIQRFYDEHNLNDKTPV